MSDENANAEGEDNAAAAGGEGAAATNDGGDAGSEGSDGDKKAVNASQDGQGAADAGDGGGDAGGNGGDAGGDKPALGDADVAAWRKDIKDEKVRKWADGFRTPAEMAEAGFGLRQKVSTAIVKPGKDASGDEVAAFRRAMDIPDEPAGYDEAISKELREQEEGKASRASFYEFAHQAGMSRDQVAGAFDWYMKAVEKSGGDAVKAAEKRTQETIDKMKSEEGDEFDKNNKIAERTFLAFGDDDAKKFFEETEVDGVQLGNHPALRNFALRVGLQMQEAKPGIALSDEAKGSLEDQHRKLSAEINDALDRGDRATAERLDEQRTVIADKLVGKNPIVGSEGMVA